MQWETVNCTLILLIILFIKLNSKQEVDGYQEKESNGGEGGRTKGREEEEMEERLMLK